MPAGWKRHPTTAAVYCGLCWSARYVLRAVTLPIAGPVSCEWPELRAMLKASWIATTAASNWTVRQLCLGDPGQIDGKLAKMPQVRPDDQSLYLGVTARWPDELDSRTAAALVRQVESKYRKLRFDLSLCRISLPTHRYPVPIPIHNNTWRVTEDPGGAMLLDMPLGRKRRVTVRLRGGQDFRRQIGALRRMIAGEVIQGELSIFRISANRTDNRNGDTPATRVMAKMVGWFPREVQAARKPDTMVGLHTGGDAFLTLLDANEKRIFRWNADHLRRGIVAHDDQLQRLREDLKAERRLKRDRAGIVQRMDLIARKQRNRLDTFCHTVAREVANMLARRRCSLVVYVDADQSYMPHFPWFKLKGLLAEKCDQEGIEFASGDAVPEAPDPLEPTPKK